MLVKRTLILLLLLSLPLAAQEPLSQQLDAIASAYFAPDAPGAAVLVLKGGKPLLRKGYGMADLEQGTKITPESVFRIGSITKQFTAVAILQLVEQGKVALSDPITKFLPDYPTQGKTITVEHLLTHTSGIQSYTDKPEFLEAMRRDMTPQQIMEAVQNDPMQFDPAAQFRYNNSGYILLGMIIEKVSGMPYAECMEKNLFPRAGLTATLYGDTGKIVRNRVPGYTRNGDSFANANFLSMTLPYSAGALLSTVDDLGRWHAALVAGKVVDRKLLDAAWRPYKLASGEEASYGYGWGVGSVLGEKVIQHGGGINGYTSHEMWVPEHDVYVTILTNNETGDPSPDFVAGLLALQAIGKPVNTKVFPMTEQDLGSYTGVYRIDDNTTRTITLDGGVLYSQRSGSQRLVISPTAKDQFIFKNSFTRMNFERDERGTIVAMIVDDGRSKTRAGRTGEKSVAREEITIDPATLDRYVGRYALAPTFIITITKKEYELWSAATGQPEVQIFPESEARWFLKVVDAQLTFDFGPDGVVKGLTLHQGGRNMPAPKVP
jgi:CubicO group peptidase (beta-lactamase class C family)